MDIESTDTRALIRNTRIELDAGRQAGRLALTLSALDGDAQPTPILRRVGQNATGDAMRVELPENCTFEIIPGSRMASLVIRGTVATAGYAIHLRIDRDSPWVDIVETLSLDAAPNAPSVDWFEAAWEFVDWEDPGEVFSPVLVPESGDVVGRHVMRAPALTAQCGPRAAALVYSPDSVYRSQVLPACMNLLRQGRTPVFRSGLRPHQVRGHVYYEYAPSPARQSTFHHAYHLYVSTNARAGDAQHQANRLLWQRYGTRSLRATPPAPLSWEEYAQQIYPLVLDRLWAETHLDGRRVGAICANRAYPQDVWMCTWFNQLRSAYGLYLWGKWLDNEDWVARAVATRDLHLASPQENGLFATLFVFGERPDTCRWVHSHPQGGGPGIYHLYDMSWTVYQLLRWHRDLIPDERSLAFARAYGRGILQLQAQDGSLPAYVDAKRFTPLDRVDRTALIADLEKHPGGDRYVQWGLEKAWGEERFTHSAEDTASLLTLAELAKALPPNDPERDRFLDAAHRLAGWLEEWVYSENRWTDYEVYFSCSPKPLDFYDSRSGQWPQNTLCMHLAAAGFLTLYELTNESHYLALAQRAMDRLCLYQQVWDPPFFNFYGFGGYGVMNTDGEWNDARQAQFADTHLDFYRALGDREHLERAQAACRAGFTTTFLPATSALYPTGWCRDPQGMAAENHAHGGRDHLCGVSGFDWGSGSALATAAYLKLHRVQETCK